jgi:DNA processing protein
MRNAVMSGMSLATVIVEASQTSGARTQARLALAHGRPVIVMKHLLGQEWGRALAARPGVHVAATADQVADVVERISSATTPLEP